MTTRVDHYHVLLLGPRTFGLDALAVEFGQSGVEAEIEHITSMGDLTSSLLTGDWQLILIAPAVGIDIPGAMNLVSRTGFQTPVLVLPSAESSGGAVARLFAAAEAERAAARSAAPGVAPATGAASPGEVAPDPGAIRPGAGTQGLDLGACMGRMDEMLRALGGTAVDYAHLSRDYLLLLEAEPGEPEVVILALADNAVRAMPQGGRLLIETRLAGADELAAAGQPAGVTADADSGGDTPRFASISITDTGIGMDARTAARAFEACFSEWPSGRRAGLGLAQARSVLEARGGSARIESRPGEGTIVRLLWPVHRD